MEMVKNGKISDECQKGGGGGRGQSTLNYDLKIFRNNDIARKEFST